MTILPLTPNELLGVILLGSTIIVLIFLVLIVDYMEP